MKRWQIALLIFLGVCSLVICCGALGILYLPTLTELASVAPTYTPTSTPKPTSLPKPSPVWTKTLEPALRSDILNLPFTRGAPPVTFDPALASDTSSSEVIVEIFSGLVTIDRDLQVKPDLAESWTVSNDRKTYTFKLHPNAKFHNGKPITANDIKYSLERAADPATHSPIVLSRLSDIVGVKERLDGRAKEVSGIQVVDERTVQIALDAPKSYFLAQLATNVAFVVDKENVETGGNNWFMKPNGSGAYKLQSYEPNRQITFLRNDEYVGSPKPTIKTVKYWFNPTGSFVTQYLRGDLDSALVHSLEVDAVFSSNSPVRTEAIIAPTFRIEYIGLNTKLSPFDDVKVRQAFNLALDKQAIADRALYRTALPAKGILPPGFPGFNPQVKGLDYDPLNARQLIKESKYGDVNKLPKITLVVNAPSMVVDEVVRMVRQNLGIDITVRLEDFSAMMSDLQSSPMPLQMYSGGRIPEVVDPVYIEPLFDSQGSSNYMGYSNAEVDSLLEKARTEPDEQERLLEYQQAEQLIVNDAPWIPIAFNDNYWLTKPFVQNLTYPPMIIPRLKYVSITP